MFNKLLRVFLAALLLLTGILAAVPPLTQNQPQVIEQANHFPLKGKLMQTHDGFVYVKVSDRYITDLLPLIETSGKLTPPRSMTSRNGIGAHISVFYSNEIERAGINYIPELGHEFNFTITGIKTIQQQVDKSQRLWIIQVHAPELERLRSSYGMAPLLKGHQFHITLGMESKKNR